MEATNLNCSKVKNETYKVEPPNGWHKLEYERV